MSDFLVKSEHLSIDIRECILKNFKTQITQMSKKEQEKERKRRSNRRKNTGK